MRKRFPGSTNLNLEAPEISTPSPYKSALFSAEACRVIEGQFVRFCSLRIGVWPDPALKKLARKLQATHRWRSPRSHLIERASLQQWQSPVSIDQGSTALRKLQNSSLRELQDSSLKKPGSASLKKLARKLRADQNICSRQKTRANAVKKCWKDSLRNDRCARLRLI